MKLKDRKPDVTKSTVVLYLNGEQIPIPPGLDPGKFEVHGQTLLWINGRLYEWDIPYRICEMGDTLDAKVTLNFGTRTDK